MEIVKLVKITFNHLPQGASRETALKECTDHDPATVRQIVIDAAKKCGETRPLDDLAHCRGGWGPQMRFDIRFGNMYHSNEYAECELITTALKVDGRYFKAEEILS